MNQFYLRPMVLQIPKFLNCLLDFQKHFTQFYLFRYKYKYSYSNNFTPMCPVAEARFVLIFSFDKKWAHESRVASPHHPSIQKQIHYALECIRLWRFLLHTYECSLISLMMTKHILKCWFNHCWNLKFICNSTEKTTFNCFNRKLIF